MGADGRAEPGRRLVIAALLAALHAAAPRIRKLPFVSETATGSFAGGLAVAYVFLHLLPEIAEGNEAIGEALSDVLRPTPLVELGIFLVALVDFTAFYGLERLAKRQGSPRPRRGGAAGSAVQVASRSAAAEHGPPAGGVPAAPGIVPGLQRVDHIHDAAAAAGRDRVRGAVQHRHGLALGPQRPRPGGARPHPIHRREAASRWLGPCWSGGRWQRCSPRAARCWSRYSPPCSAGRSCSTCSRRSCRRPAGPASPGPRRSDRVRRPARPRHRPR